MNELEIRKEWEIWEGIVCFEERESEGKEERVREAEPQGYT